MNTMHDDDLDARLEVIRRKHNSEWTTYDLDDIGTAAMLRGFDALEELQRKGLLPPPPPPRPRPQKKLVQALTSIGCVYDPVRAAERRLITWPFERALFEIVREINATQSNVATYRPIRTTNPRAPLPRWRGFCARDPVGPACN